MQNISLPVAGVGLATQSCPRIDKRTPDHDLGSFCSDCD